jgi:hypothetical protein
VARNQAGPDAAGDSLQLAVTDQTANLVFGAAKLGGNLAHGQGRRPVHSWEYRGSGRVRIASVPEAKLEDLGSGLVPVTEGWFVVNVRDAEWWFTEAESPSWSRRPASSSSRLQCWKSSSLSGTTRSRHDAPASRTQPGSVDDLDASYARAVEAGGRSVWTPRGTPQPGLRIAFVADPDGNLVQLLSSEEIVEEV